MNVPLQDPVKPEEISYSPEEIKFTNGHIARLLTVEEAADPVDVLGALGLQPPRAVIVISGGAGNMDRSQSRRLAPFFSLGIAGAAKDLHALIIDGGTQAGVMELMGKGVDGQDGRIDLIGVAPSGKVIVPGSSGGGNDPDRAPLDPNHTHFVLSNSKDWGDETPLMYNLAEALQLGKVVYPGAAPAGEKKLPILTILAGGRIGGIAMQEALATVRKKWPLVVMEGSGQLADEIARRYRRAHWQGRFPRGLSGLGASIRRRFSPALQEADAYIDEIVEDGRIILFTRNRKPSDLKKLLTRQLKEKAPDSILLHAWKRFADYDLNAAMHQKTYRMLKTWPLNLGVVATALILGQEFLVTNKLIQEGNLWSQILRVLIILVPIIVSLFLAAERLFKSGNKWLLLRYYAEEIKKDIYSYRVLSAVNLDSQTNLPVVPTDLPNVATDLSDSIKQIGQRLMRTEVNESALKPYGGPVPPAMYGDVADDDGLSPLNIEDYIKVRLNAQLNFYSLKTNRLEKQLQPRQWLILVFGAAGSLLAALGGAFQFWVPLTVAVVSALTAYLEYQQVEQTIVKYNQAMTKLANLVDEWIARPSKEKEDPKNIVQLVEAAEQVMQSEHLGWVQQMQTTQAAPQKTETSPEEKKSGSKQPAEDKGKSGTEKQKEPEIEAPLADS